MSLADGPPAAEENDRQGRIQHLESIVADPSLGVVHRNKAKIELAQLRDDARLAAEAVIYERRARLQAAARQRREEATRRKEEARRRSREADAAVAGAEAAAEAAIAASKRALAELAQLRDIAGQERRNAKQAEREFAEFARLEREIEREFEEFAGGATNGDEGDDGRYAEGESHDDLNDSATHGDDHVDAAEAIAGMEAEMRHLSQEGHWKRQCEELSAEVERLSIGWEECEARAAAAEAKNEQWQKIAEEYGQVLERKEGELAKSKRMMKAAYEAEEAAQRSAKEAGMAAREASERLAEAEVLIAEAAEREAEAAAKLKADAEARAAAAAAAEAKAAQEAADERSRLAEEAERAARRAEEAAARAAAEEARRTRLVVLVSDGVADVQQRSDQRHALRLLTDFRIPHDVIDGAEGSRGRDALCAISGIKGHYPQIFRVTGEAGVDSATYLGGYRWLERMGPDKLRDLFPLPPGGWTSAASRAKDAELARATRALAEEREKSARERQALQHEVEELEDALIKASELLDREKERAAGLEREVDRLSHHGEF